MDYQLTTNDTIVRTTDGAFIPPDPGNTDYQRYQSWLEDGNEPKPAPEPPAPPVLTPAEKLAASGLTVEELRQLLA